MKDETRALSEQFSVASRPIITVDVEKYQGYLDGSGLSQAQKEEVLQAMWLIIVSFVELGFGVHPAQEACGKTLLLGEDASQTAPDEVSSRQPENERKPLDSAPMGRLEDR